MSLLEAAKERVRGLRGVVRVESLEAEDRDAIRGMATKSAAENRGVAEVLSRDAVLCLFKGPEFRPPPEPTILLVDETGRVLGREVLPGEDVAATSPRRVVRLGKDFVIYTDQPSGTQYRFLLPPVPFPELEAIPGLADVVSASPDPPQDDFMKRRFAVPLGTEHASILVGFNLRNP